MQIDLNGRSVLLGVTGSISAYKACDLARLFVKAGADVHVVMSPSAGRFVSPLTFEALTRNSVLTEESESWSSDLNHIDMGKKADVFIIAPATANTLNKLSKGIADNILLQTALAFKGTLLVAPAANTQMLKNHYTERSIKMLRVNDIVVIDPQSKQLACGDTGEGALANPEEIFFETAKAMLIDPFWKDRRVVVTGGGTREKIDEVRYISNYSSGKMAKAVSLSLYLRGADVCYITTQKSNDLPKGINIINVESAEEMLQHTSDTIVNSQTYRKKVHKTTFLFMVAAIADYKPKFPQSGKLKKSMLGEVWNLEMVQTPDILSSINKDGIRTVAFKAEMDKAHGLENAKALLDAKEVDAVCYNLLSGSDSFGTDSNEIEFITPDHITPLGKADKLTLASKILDEARKLADD